VDQPSFILRSIIEVMKMAELLKTKKFLTQSELAERWRLTESTIKNLRDRGQLPYFRLPGSSRVLYATEVVKELERLHTTPAKEVDKERHRTEITRKKPDISATSKKEWRI
jgi:hypothetical protein